MEKAGANVVPPKEPTQQKATQKALPSTNIIIMSLITIMECYENPERFFWLLCSGMLDSSEGLLKWGYEQKDFQTLMETERCNMWFFQICSKSKKAFGFDLNRLGKCLKKVRTTKLCADDGDGFEREIEKIINLWRKYMGMKLTSEGEDPLGPEGVTLLPRTGTVSGWIEQAINTQFSGCPI